MRMGMRCFTRLTNAFSKKVEDLTHVVAPHCMHCNCCRSDQSLGQKTTPALPVGWPITSGNLDEVIGLLARVAA
jgi:hypothetical protein